MFRDIYSDPKSGEAVEARSEVEIKRVTADNSGPSSGVICRRLNPETLKCNIYQDLNNGVEPYACPFAGQYNERIMAALKKAIDLYTDLEHKS